MAVATAAGASPQHALMETARMELIKLRSEVLSNQLKVSASSCSCDVLGISWIDRLMIV